MNYRIAPGSDSHRRYVYIHIWSRSEGGLSPQYLGSALRSWRKLSPRCFLALEGAPRIEAPPVVPVAFAEYLVPAKQDAREWGEWRGGGEGVWQLQFQGTDVHCAGGGVRSQVRLNRAVVAPDVV